MTDKEALNLLFDGKSIEWTEHTFHTTKTGKQKEVLRGIPLSGFWLYYKRNKEEFKRAGLTLFAGKAEKTGDAITRKGKSIEVKRRAWELTLWVNARNDARMRQAGFERMEAGTGEEMEQAKPVWAMEKPSKAGAVYLAATQGPSDDPF